MATLHEKVPAWLVANPFFRKLLRVSEVVLQYTTVGKSYIIVWINSSVSSDIYAHTGTGNALKFIASLMPLS